ncbi:MAG: hypothetical protein DRI75_12040 [Bacteroidetes bacterium]|nr:MAG: hypothetical protein DRI75_12040 [Bacteroidota bacterium]
MGLNREQDYYLSMIILLEDVQHQFMKLMQPEYRHELKKMFNNCENATRLYLIEVDKKYNNLTDELCEDSDNIIDLLHKNFYLKIKQDE